MMVCYKLRAWKLTFESKLFSESKKLIIKCALGLAHLSKYLDFLLLQRIAQIMDAADEADIMPAFNRGPNPFLDKEKCLLCGVDRTEPVPSSSEGSGILLKNYMCVCPHCFQWEVWIPWISS